MESRLFVWDMQTGNEMWRLDPLPPPPNQPGRPGELNSLTFLPDGKLLIAGRGDDLLVTWSPTTGMQTHKLNRELALAGGLAISPDGKTLAVNPDFGSSIRLVDWESAKVRFPDISYTPVELTGVTANGETVVMTGGHHVSVWEPATGKARVLLERPEIIFWQARLMPDGRLQIWDIFPRTVSDMAVSLWDLASGAELQKIQCAEKLDGSLYPLAITPDGKTAAMLEFASTRKVLLLETSTRKILRTLTGNVGASRATFTSDGRKLVVWCAGEPSALHVWETATGQRLNTIEFPRPDFERPGLHCEPVVSDDGQVSVVESRNKSFSVFDLKTGQLIRQINDLFDAPQTMALSHDRSLLAWSGQHKPVVAVVELATGRERYRFVGHEGKVTSLAFSSDNKMLVTHSEDTTTLAWDLTGRPMGGSAKK